MTELLQRRPLLICVAGPNGAGKSTFFESHLAASGLRFINADEIARELSIDSYLAADIAEQVRAQLVDRRESFIFETVFSDPVGEKLAFLIKAESLGYTVVLMFIGIEDAVMSQVRVSIRAAKGGHDVPNDKLAARYARTMENLRRALISLGNVHVYDNSDLIKSHRLVAQVNEGRLDMHGPTPAWLKPLLPRK
jgi:predicted ABC-type ATPase